MLHSNTVAVICVMTAFEGFIFFVAVPQNVSSQLQLQPVTFVACHSLLTVI